jgi:hypothetical protein
MKITWSNAAYAMNQCARFIAVSVSNLKVLDSIQRISSKSPRRLSRDYSQMQSAFGTLSARSHQGFNSRLKGVARVLAVVIGLSLSMAFMPRLEASIVPNKKLRQLANYQLTDKQYQCHNEIVHRESSWNINAIGNKSGTKQTHGYYQIKSESVKGKPYDYQFYMYWYYVSSRYGLDYEIPDYCKALHHLKTKGWQ